MIILIYIQTRTTNLNDGDGDIRGGVQQALEACFEPLVFFIYLDSTAIIVYHLVLLLIMKKQFYERLASCCMKLDMADKLFSVPNFCQ